MQPTQVTPNLMQLTRVRFVNAYLVREDDGFTLVDTTVPGSASALISAARSAGAEIRRIALTHGHNDHVGSLDALKRELGDGVEVLIPERDAQLLAGDKTIDGKKIRGFPTIKTVPDRRLADGERVGHLEVVASPGHTPGHVAFLDTRDRTLIAGDAYSTLGGVEVSSHVNWRFPLPALGTWNRPLALASAQRLRQLDPAVLATGHGRAIADPATRMDQAIARAGGTVPEQRIATGPRA